MNTQPTPEPGPAVQPAHEAAATEPLPAVAPGVVTPSPAVQPAHPFPGAAFGPAEQPEQASPMTQPLPPVPQGAVPQDSHATQPMPTQPMPTQPMPTEPMPTAPPYAGQQGAFTAPIPGAQPHSVPNSDAQPSRARRLLNAWGRGWWALTYVVLSSALGGLYLVPAILVVTGIGTIPAVGTGLVLIPAGLWLAFFFAWFERRRVAVFLGVEVPDPTSLTLPWWKMLWLHPMRWRETAGMLLHGVWGLITGVGATWLLSRALGVLATPLYVEDLATTGIRPFAILFGSGFDWFFLMATDDMGQPWTITGGLGIGLLFAAAILIILLLPFAALGTTIVDAHIATWLLVENPDRRVRQLQERNIALEATRSETVSSVEAERARIERDLHDGPQQRLVSVAMDIGMARIMLDSDPAQARGILDGAHTSAKAAITEMRQVARGIVPPVLADRGLDAAFSALAARSPVPVEVYVDPRVGRLDAAIEAIAYFSASEALTNVAKHSRATKARLALAPADDGSSRIVLTVHDDGVGGAYMANGDGPAGPAFGTTTGTGLRGLRQRAAAVDGTVQVYSPPGGPTLITIALPWVPARPAQPAPGVRYAPGAQHPGAVPGQFPGNAPGATSGNYPGQAPFQNGGPK